MDRFNNAQEHRPSYGHLPNQAAVDLKEEEKLRKCEWDLTKYQDLLDLFVFRSMKVFFLRASKEVQCFLVFLLCVFCTIF